MKLNDTTVNYLAQFCFGAAAIAFPPAAIGATAAVGATALVALFHSERKKRKDAAQLDSEKALNAITAKIADEWRSNLPAQQQHEYLKELHLAEEALQKALPHCTMDYATLAQTTTEGAGKFPDKATALVVSQLAEIAPDHFGEQSQGIAKDFARDVIQSAFKGAIENEAYFEKFKPQVLLAIAEKQGEIYDMQEALKELAERNYEILVEVDDRTMRMEAKLDQLTSIVGSMHLRRAEEIGLNNDQIVTIADSFLEQGIPPELWGEKLVEGATRLIQLEEDLEQVTKDEPEIAALIEMARTAIDQGNIERADRHLEEAVTRDESAGQFLMRRAAENEARRANLAYSEGRYIKAADHFARAAKNVRPFDELDWARLKYHEGSAAYERGKFDPERGSFERAIAAYREALMEATRERVPLEWAMTQNNLGNALATLGHRGDNTALKNAIPAYREALKEVTRDRLPLAWAKTQNNLGAALATLGTRGDDEALRQAIHAYHEALKEGTRDRVPLDWAATQNNLGNALATLGTRGDDEALRQAIHAYREALKEGTRDRVPLDWAATQNNLGIALTTLGRRGDDEALKEAIHVCSEALKEYTRDRVPLDWAMTQNNLGEAFELLGDCDVAIDSWMKAHECYRAALEEYTPDRAPAYETDARKNLVRVEQKLKAAGGASPKG